MAAPCRRHLLTLDNTSFSSECNAVSLPRTSVTRRGAAVIPRTTSMDEEAKIVESGRHCSLYGSHKTADLDGAVRVVTVSQYFSSSLWWVITKAVIPDLVKDLMLQYRNGISSLESKAVGSSKIRNCGFIKRTRSNAVKNLCAGVKHDAFARNGKS